MTRPVERGPVRLWALRTGVPDEWLQTGEIPDQGPVVVSRLDSNQD